MTDKLTKTIEVLSEAFVKIGEIISESNSYAKITTTIMKGVFGYV